jgi:hypothetical protein
VDGVIGLGTGAAKPFAPLRADFSAGVALQGRRALAEASARLGV